jgi:Tol biopolymer transport system component
VVNLTNVTAGAAPAADSQASYSPDGSQIAFSSAVGDQSQIFVMDADGTHVRQLTQDAFDDSSPAWSPDGKTLAYASYQGSTPLQSGSTSIDSRNLTGWALMSLNPVSGASSVVTTSNDGMADPEYSPDGQNIAYLAMTPTGGTTPYVQPDIYVVNASGGVATPRQPTTSVNELFFDWR